MAKLVAFALIAASLVLQSESLTRGKANANVTGSASWSVGPSWAGKSGGKKQFIKNFMARKAASLSSVRDDPKNGVSTQEIDSLKREAESNSVQVMGAPELMQMASEKQILLKEAAGSLALAGLLAEVPLSTVEIEIDRMRQTADMAVNVNSQVETIVLLLSPKAPNQESVDGPEAGHPDYEEPEVDSDDKEEKKGRAYQSKRGLISKISVNALTPTEGMIFNLNECQNLDNNSPNTLNIPSKHATFKILDSGIQTVPLDRVLEIDLETDIVMVLQNTSGIVPIAAHESTADPLAGHEIPPVEADAPKLKVDELHGTVLDAQFIPELNAYSVRHEEFDHSHVFQIFMMPVVEVIDLEDTVLFTNRGAPQMLLTDGIDRPDANSTANQHLGSWRSQLNSKPSHVESNRGMANSTVSGHQNNVNQTASGVNAAPQRPPTNHELLFSQYGVPMN